MTSDSLIVTARPLGAPMPLLPIEDEPVAGTSPRFRPWKGWQGDLRFFATAYLAGFVFFLAVLS